MTETGYAGRNSNGGILRPSRMGHGLEINGLNLPDPEKLHYYQDGAKFPYYFVADEAFPLKSYLMRPYPKRKLNNIQRVGYIIADYAEPAKLWNVYSVR
jgi:hypothetical protein